MKYESMDKVIADMTKAVSDANSKQEVQEVLKNIGEVTLQINLTDLDGWMTQVVDSSGVNIHAGQVGESPVREFIDSDSFVKIMSGAVEPPELAMAGKINFEGDFSKVFMLQPLLPHIIQSFQKTVLGDK